MIFENALITWLTGTTQKLPYHAHVIKARAATRARDARDARALRPYQYVTRIIHHTALSTTRARI